MLIFLIKMLQKNAQKAMKLTTKPEDGITGFVFVLLP